MSPTSRHHADVKSLVSTSHAMGKVPTSGHHVGKEQVNGNHVGTYVLYHHLEHSHCFKLVKKRT